MRCLIIGGAGFLGSHIVEKLIDEHHQVTVFDIPSSNNYPYLANLGVSIIEGSVLDPVAVKKSLKGQEIVYLLSSTTTPVSSNKNPCTDVEQNLISAINIMQLSGNEGVKKIIFSSSGGTVYGVPQMVPISEQHPTDPICSYGIVKLAIEKYLHLYRTLYGLDYTILRISNAYGERQTIHGNQGLIPAVIRSGFSMEDIEIRGTGGAIRDYVYCQDIAAAFVKALTYCGERKIFNIGSGVGYSVNQVIGIVQDYFPQKFHIKYTDSIFSDVPVNILDIALAKQELGWSPLVNLEKGISNTIEWYKSNKAGS